MSVYILFDNYLIFIKLILFNLSDVSIILYVFYIFLEYLKTKLRRTLHVARKYAEYFYQLYTHTRSVRTASDVETYTLILLLLKFYRYFLADFYLAGLRILPNFLLLGFRFLR